MKFLFFSPKKHHCQSAEHLLLGEVVAETDYIKVLEILNTRPAPDYEFVVIDLLAPASHFNQGEKGKRYGGIDLAPGIVIALSAVTAGIKNVIVVTDSCVHHHPSVVMVLNLRPARIGESKVSYHYSVTTHIDSKTFEKIDQKFLDSLAGQEKYPEEDGGKRNGVIKTYDFGRIISLHNSLPF